MSGSDMLPKNEPFALIAGVQGSPASSTPAAAAAVTTAVQPVSNMRLDFSIDGTAVYKPVSSWPAPYPPSEAPAAGATALPLSLNVSGESSRKKRGRPRKYGPDGSITFGTTAMSSPSAAVIPQGGTFSPHLQPPSAATPSSAQGPKSPPSAKKARGRPRGSGKKQQAEALGSAGIGFMPHVIDVKAGEDVSSKIMSFSQHGPRAICILSATGALSNVTLRRPATSGGTATYEGRFEILSLSGSFLLSEVGGQRSRTGGLSVSLIGPDGQIFGGCVAGVLTAASHIQVIVGSFVPDGRKERPLQAVGPAPAPSNTTSTNATGASSSPSQGTHYQSSGVAGSPQGTSSLTWK